MPTLRKAISDRLRARGFRRIDGGKHLLTLDPEWSLYVDTGTLGTATGIAPWVGLRSEAIESARAELMKVPSFPGSATVSSNVGYVLDGTYRSWSARSEGKVASNGKAGDAQNKESVRKEGSDARSGKDVEEVEEIDQAIRTALERLRPLASFATLPAAFEIEPNPTMPGRFYVGAILPLLTGNAAATHAALAAGREHFARHAPDIRAQCEAFADRVLARMSEPPVR
ncbi:MAG: hypothetical protein KBF21_18760 [Thermoanaerobaculia bacterium]|nr:hypothetical protein [Thermoanaerobaculia bacterium]MBP9826276.1 hypothetical protein [Thermoanaerobaculia bacterium]